MQWQQARVSLARGLLLCTLVACQDYPFETREKRVSKGREITELVTTVTPADILFVLDNSGSMIDEINELVNNLDTFVRRLTDSANDYQLGFITPDVECNVPGRNCVAGGSSAACCDLNRCPMFPCDRTCIGGQCMCQDQDLIPDGVIDFSNCDGGRLRGDSNGLRLFARPPDANILAFQSAVREAVGSLGCKGSSYEAGLEAARRAVVCGMDSTARAAAGLTCPDQAIADLNAGFIRPDADLIIIFVSDEDDCSFYDGEISKYNRPNNNALEEDQRNHLCSPNECYAYHGVNIDTCGTFPRRVNPPLPNDVSTFLADIIAAKGGDANRVHAGGILGAVEDARQPFGFRASACKSLQNLSGPSESCGCWTNTNNDLFCEITASQSVCLPNAGCTGTCAGGCETIDLGANRAAAQSACTSAVDCHWSPLLTRFPLGGGMQPVCGGGTQSAAGGCQSMTGERYVQFFEALALARAGTSASTCTADAMDSAECAGTPCLGGFCVDKETVVDTVCNPLYNEAFDRMVGLIGLDNCFNLQETVEFGTDLAVIYYDFATDPQYERGVPLNLVPEGSPSKGFSFVDGSDEICLEGGLVKKIDDKFEIFVLDNN